MTARRGFPRTAPAPAWMKSPQDPPPPRPPPGRLHQELEDARPRVSRCPTGSLPRPGVPQPAHPPSNLEETRTETLAHDEPSDDPEGRARRPGPGPATH